MTPDRFPAARSPASLAGCLRVCWQCPLLALSLLAGGCQHLEPESREGPSEADLIGGGTPGLQREVAMNRRWQHRRLSEVKRTLGEPQAIFDIPGGGNPPGLVAVFGLDAQTGCLDAFAIYYGKDPQVRVYHCR